MTRNSFESQSMTPADETFDQFVNTEAIANQQALLRELVAGAPGSTREEDIQRLDEAKVYFNHLAAMGSDREDDLNNTPSPAFEREWDDAITENTTFDQARVDSQAAFTAKIASNPKTRRLQGVANEVIAMREQLAGSPNDVELAKHLKNREDSLEELLISFDETSTLPSTEKNLMIDYFIDPSTPIYERLATEGQLDPELSAQLDKMDAEQEMSNVERDSQADLDEEALALLDIDEASQIEINPGDQPDSEPSLSDEEALAALDLEAENQVEIEVGNPYSDNQVTSEEQGEALDVQTDEPESKEFTWLRNPLLKSSALYTSALTSLTNFRHSRTGKHSMNSTIEGESKRGSRKATVIAVGALAVVGAIAAWRIGISLDHHSIDPNSLPLPSNTPETSAPSAPGVTTPGGSEIIPPVSSPTPETTQHIIETYRSAFDVPNGSGGISLVERLGGSEADWYNKVSPGLVDKYPEYFQNVTNNSGQPDIWIRQPGQLPVAVEQDILQRLGKL